MTKAMVILQTILEHQLGALLARFPPRRDHATRRLSTKVLDQLVALIHDGGLLFEAHCSGVLVGVAVQTNLVAGIPDHCALFGKSLEGMPGYEPCCFDVVLGKELEKAPDTNCAGEETARDVACGVLSSVGAEPSRYSIDIN